MQISHIDLVRNPREAIPHEVAFCYRRGTTLKSQSKLSGILTADAILSIVASLVSLFIGVSDTQTYLFYVRSDFRITIPEVYLIVGIWGLIAFALGFAGGIFAIKRQHFSAVVAGFISMTALGFSLLAHGYTGEFFGAIAFLLWGIPLIFLCSLGLLLAGAGKSEFLLVPTTN